MKMQVKQIAKVFTGTTPPTNEQKYYESEDINWYSPGDIVSDSISLKDSNKKISRLYFQEKNSWPFPQGAVLMVGIGATVGKVAYSDSVCWSNQQINVIVFDKKKILPKFGAYQLLNKSKEINKKTPVVTLQIFNQSKVRQIELWLPSLETQHRIVTYLDTKLSEIDHQVSILTSKRDAYLRLKKSIINHAVTRGLNPNVKMKDSGIEWIGEVPGHWRRMRLKDIAYLYSGLTGKSGDDFRCDNTNITKPYVPFTSILNNFKINSTDFPRVIMSDNETQNQVIVNDLLFLMSSEDYDSIAKSAVVNENLGEVYLNSFCRGLRFTSKDIFANFVNYQIQATNYRDALRFEARGFTRINIKIEKISSMFVCLPPLPEQRVIATYLDDKCAKIDTIVSNLDKQISRYADLKRSLIDEVITGKRAV